MTKQTTQKQQYTDNRPTLFMSFELGAKEWQLGFCVGLGQKARRRRIAAGNLEGLRVELLSTKERFGLDENVRVVSCYEAGRDGFWLDRCLRAGGIENLVVDSSSIEVNRRQRRAKSDRLDVQKLLTMLVRYDLGEHKVWSVVRVPSTEEEDGRQLHRELGTLKKEKTRTINRIRGLMASQGVRLGSTMDLSEQRLEEIRLWDGSPLPVGLKQRVKLEWERVLFLRQQIRTLKTEQRRKLQEGKEPDMAKIDQLCKLRGIGPTSGWVLVREFFGWREFRNRRQVGGLSGLTSTPYQSGEMNREQGISHAGNHEVRAIAVELAWSWVRYQPESKLTQWYVKRFARAGRRVRKVGIVALARRLLIDLWRYLEHGVLPEGARLKAEAHG